MAEFSFKGGTRRGGAGGRVPTSVSDLSFIGSIGGGGVGNGQIGEVLAPMFKFSFNGGIAGGDRTWGGGVTISMFDFSFKGGLGGRGGGETVSVLMSDFSLTGGTRGEGGREGERGLTPISNFPFKASVGGGAGEVVNDEATARARREEVEIKVFGVLLESVVLRSGVGGGGGKNEDLGRVDETLATGERKIVVYIEGG
ncbi:uncharacterized PE-PGRS family protein PE_PGRS54-like [Mangifera indica]|uniref:uncharacterized PE-PGRS family protein PE_PGRS54-like n=1 Tax=Mangifera indica TaxID=29780 RepID=UPI001CFA3BD3|nr:uncharacterized PE-PGRS family protein PE_PGRS54-like [Mangifera indica]